MNNQHILLDYDKYVKDYKLIYGEKTIILIQLGSFFEMCASLDDQNKLGEQNINSICDDILNIVIEISTKLTPIKLLNKCKEIELYLGRKKAKKNSPRKCDIDILDYNNKKIKGKIILPHPRMHKRNFVLLPLFELNKDWKHPVLKHHIKKLIFSLPNVDIRSINQI